MINGYRFSSSAMKGMNQYTFIVLASDVWFSKDMLYVRLQDGRELGVPLLWFPRLRKATEAQLNEWRLIGNGVGIHWETIDEDISVAALL